MVIGNGLLANAFSQYKNEDNVIIFASGVSNSSTNRSEEFEREINLLKKYLIEDKKIIYFSTCSITDNSKRSDYINHKIFMEDFIKSNHNNYIIFRLPIVVGKCSNKNTFFNNIRGKILNKETIMIYKNLTRYLIDIDDLSNILPNIIDSESKNFTIDTCFNNNLNILDIVSIMEDILKIECNKIIETTEFTNNKIDNTEFLNKLKLYGFEDEKNYTDKILRKYL
jgi:hypothetical protein